MMSTLDKVQLLEQRIIKATVLIHNLQKKNEELSDQVELLSVHNEELKAYADKYSSDSKAIEASITNAMELLNGIAGLDDIELPDSQIAQALDLETADQFTGGAGISMDEVSLDEMAMESMATGDAVSLDDLVR